MSVVDNLKDIVSLVKKIDNIELNRRIVNLESEVFDLIRENRDLNDKVEELKTLFAISKKMIFKSPFYYTEGDEIPYCPKCWETEKKAIHLLVEDVAAGLRYDCPNCKLSRIPERKKVSTNL